MRLGTLQSARSYCMISLGWLIRLMYDSSNIALGCLYLVKV